MKKTIFTTCSVMAVCVAIFFACTKDNTAGSTQVSYNTQPGYGTGGNPNPNSNASGTSTGVTTSSTNGTTGTTTGTTTGGSSLTYNATACTSVSTSTNSNSFLEVSSTAQVQVTFPGTTLPASGAYTIVTGSPVGNQCTFHLLAPTSAVAAGGVVNVTAAASPNNVATFSGIICGTNTVTGTAKY